MKNSKNKSLKRLLIAVIMLAVSIANYILSSHNLVDKAVTNCISVLIIIVALPLAIVLSIAAFKALSSNKEDE